MTGAEIVYAARQCLSTPFRHQGRLVGVGLDCAGVIVHVGRTIGVDVIDVDGYGRTPNDNQLLRTLDLQTCLRVVPDNSCRQIGDILLMRIATDPQHLSVFTGNTIIHAHEASGQCVEHVLSPVWASRIVRVYRFEGVE